MMSSARNGSTFTTFLDEEGIRDEVEAVAVKRVLAWQLDEARREQNLSKTELATRMHTSRSQIDRLLDPDNTQVQLDTIQKATVALGRKIVIDLV